MCNASVLVSKSDLKLVVIDCGDVSQMTYHIKGKE